MLILGNSHNSWRLQNLRTMRNRSSPTGHLTVRMWYTFLKKMHYWRVLDCNGKPQFFLTCYNTPPKTAHKFSQADFTNCIWPSPPSKYQGKTITETISAMIPVSESICISLTKWLVLLEPQETNISFSVIMDVQFHCFFLGSLVLHKTTKVIILTSSWHL